MRPGSCGGHGACDVSKKVKLEIAQECRMPVPQWIYRQNMVIEWNAGDTRLPPC